MNKIKLIIATFSLILIGCSDDDPISPDAATFTGTGTYTLTSITIHHGTDCSSADGVLGMCFPPAETVVSESECVETGTGTCMDEYGNGIDGIDAEADCPDGNIWINFGWNLWMNIFPAMLTIFSDAGTYTHSQSGGMEDWRLGGGEEDESGTWTLDGTTLTMTSSEGEVTTATVSGSTFTVEQFDTFTSVIVDCAEMVFTK